MLKELAKVASKLDSLGLTSEADYLDLIIQKSAELDDEQTEDEPTQEGFPSGPKSYSDYAITLDELILKLNEIRSTVPGETRVFSPDESYGIRRIRGVKVSNDALVPQDIIDYDDYDRYRKTIVEVF